MRLILIVAAILCVPKELAAKTLTMHARTTTSVQLWTRQDTGVAMQCVVAMFAKRPLLVPNPMGAFTAANAPNITERCVLLTINVWKGTLACFRIQMNFRLLIMV